jgi:hypothetical protein
MLTNCTPSYYNYEGTKQQRFSLLNELHGDGPMPYFQRLRELREAGELRGQKLS